MMIQVDVSHGCRTGGAAAPGAIAVQAKAASGCCGSKLAEGGTPGTGFTCTGCGRAASRVLADPVAHWTCACGQPRTQVITRPQDG